MKHPVGEGSRNNYNYWKCRCHECKLAVREYRAANPPKPKAAMTSEQRKEYKAQLLGQEFEHGSRAGAARGCKCESCTNRRRNQVTGNRRKRGLKEGDSRHGTLNGYTNYGCRCEACTESMKEYQAKLRASKKLEDEEW